MPGKENNGDRVGVYKHRIERWLNNRLKQLVPVQLLALCGLAGITLFCLTLVINRYAGSVDVGVISAPTLLESPGEESFGELSPLEFYQDLQRSQGFLDSMERLGIDSMSAIYYNKLNATVNNTNND